MMQLSHASGSVAGLTLSPLVAADSPALEAAAQDPQTWTWWPRPMLGLPWESVMGDMLSDHAAGRMLHHVIRDGAGHVLGSTAYLNIRPKDRGVEIGFTWYVAEARGTLVNPACKLMLLSHAFACGAERVELKTHAANARSRAAILKLGATFEGIHRHHILMPDGSWRDTAWYSILRSEWPGVEAGLRDRLEQAGP